MFLPVKRDAQDGKQDANPGVAVVVPMLLELPDALQDLLIGVIGNFKLIAPAVLNAASAVSFQRLRAEAFVIKAVKDSILLLRTQGCMSVAMSGNVVEKAGD